MMNVVLFLTLFACPSLAVVIENTDNGLSLDIEIGSQDVITAAKKPKVGLSTNVGTESQDMVTTAKKPKAGLVKKAETESQDLITAAKKPKVFLLAKEVTDGEEGTLALPHLLKSLKGQSTVDCSKVCTALKSPYQSSSWQGKMDGGADYKCICGGATTVVSCVGKPFTKCCKDQCSNTGLKKDAGGKKATAGGPVAAGTLAAVIGGLKGKSTVDCNKVCKAVGKPYQSSSWQGKMDGSKDYKCICGGATTVVSCVGDPFTKCSKA